MVVKSKGKRFALVLTVNKKSIDKKLYNVLRHCGFTVVHRECSTLQSTTKAISDFKRTLENSQKLKSGFNPLSWFSKYPETIDACFVVTEVYENKNGDLESEDKKIQLVNDIMVPFKAGIAPMLLNAYVCDFILNAPSNAKKILKAEIVPELLTAKNSLNFSDAVEKFGHLEINEMYSQANISSFRIEMENGKAQLVLAKRAAGKRGPFYMKPRKIRSEKKSTPLKKTDSVDSSWKKASKKLFAFLPSWF